MAYVADQPLPGVGQRYRFLSGEEWEVTSIDCGGASEDIIVLLSLVDGKAIRYMSLADLWDATSPKSPC